MVGVGVAAVRAIPAWAGKPNGMFRRVEYVAGHPRVGGETEERYNK